jgi:ABC-type transport system involved in cytochrome bd biosynthesis fused ATPase/permease subunit
LLFGIDAIFRLLFSIFIIYLFEVVTGGELKTAYIYCGILAVIWHVSQICKQNAKTDAYVLGRRIKAALAMLLYSKITKLTLYVMKSSEIGKITNLISSDLGVI